MTERPEQQTERLLLLLADAGLPFVVIGGIAANAHGAVRQTEDLDVVMPMTPAVLDRLLDVLGPYHPKHALRRDLGPLTQRGEALATFRFVLLETDLGRLDVVAEVAPIGRYDDLETVTMTIAERRVQVLTLAQLIAVKEATGRPKDRIAVHELRAIAEMLADGDGDGDGDGAPS